MALQTLSNFENLDIKEIFKSIISRRRRDKPVMPTFEEISSKYLKWMTPEQLHKISQIKDNKNQLYDKASTQSILPPIDLLKFSGYAIF